MILIVSQQAENESIMLGCLEGCSAVRVVAVPADGEDLLADNPSLILIDTQTFREDEYPQVTLLCREIAGSRNGVPVLIHGTAEALAFFVSLFEEGKVDFISEPVSALLLFERINLLKRAAELKRTAIRFKRQYQIQNMYFSTLIDNLAFDFWAMDADLRYVMQNDHSVKKWGDVSGRSIDDLTISDTLKYIWKAEANRCLAGEIIRSEYRTEEEGEMRYLESIISPVTVDGDVQGILGITKDVSEYRRTEELLNNRKIKLEETNTALRVILKKREDDKKEIEKRVLNNLYSVVYPYLSLIAAKAKEGQIKAIEDLRLSLHEICSSFSQDLQIMKLSTTEMQVANFIRHGKNTREIAEIMCVAQSTVNTHRNNIRKKVGLKKTKKTLRAYLSSL